MKMCKLLLVKRYWQGKTDYRCPHVGNTVILGVIKLNNKYTQWWRNSGILGFKASSAYAHNYHVALNLCFREHIKITKSVVGFELCFIMQ